MSPDNRSYGPRFRSRALADDPGPVQGGSPGPVQSCWDNPGPVQSCWATLYSETSSMTKTF